MDFGGGSPGVRAEANRKIDSAGSSTLPKRDVLTHTNVAFLSPPAGPTHSRLILLMHARGPTIIKAGVPHKKRNTFSSTLSERLSWQQIDMAPVVHMDGPSCENRLLISNANCTL